jgi:hypothetical protein
MRIESCSDSINFKAYAPPRSFPFGTRVEGPDQIPALRGVSANDLPIGLCAFDSVDSRLPYEQLGIHFYRADSKISKVVTSPELFVNRFSSFGVVLTPDATLGTGMARWQRANSTFASRAAGAVWESRGIKVIPSLRWVGQEDLELVATGIRRKSVIAVSSYGMYRDHTLRFEFDFGLDYLLERLEPEALVFYGKITDKQKRTIENKSKLAHFLPKMAVQRIVDKNKCNDSEWGLFGGLWRNREIDR